ncbi:hypothetical protein D4764_03G0009320 [Takifugu flavidus]|uniref:Uncharacterized protein n=1 Tax=Takifugu flavidus TaxID=433684 RepID=A0A5C6N8V1_9TELE|nr:hypothetical protein D4764_03G0009320 [Takifugu flavidus]
MEAMTQRQDPSTIKGIGGGGAPWRSCSTSGASQYFACTRAETPPGCLAEPLLPRRRSPPQCHQIQTLAPLPFSLGHVLGRQLMQSRWQKTGAYITQNATPGFEATQKAHDLI